MATPELFDEPFNVKEYIERLAWRSLGGGARNDFNPSLLYKELSSHIEQLKILDEKLEKKANKLEQELKDDAKQYADRLVKLQSQHQDAFDCFKELDDKINMVAAKVVYLGEQLEGTNQPRAHAEEALNLMRHFQYFQEENSEELAKIYSDPKNLAKAADIIRKLKMVASELSDEKFKNVKDNINLRYGDIEHTLVAKFQDATNSKNKSEMKKYADVLSNFQGYQKCINEFVHASLKQITRIKGDGIFDQVVEQCQKVDELSSDVFSHSEQVVQKFLQDVYEEKLMNYVNYRMGQHEYRDPFLNEAYELKNKIKAMNKQILECGLTCKAKISETYLTKLEKMLFLDHVEEYVENETESLKQSCHMALEKFYEDVNHERKESTKEEFEYEEFERSMFSKLTMGMNTIDPGEAKILLGESVATNILQDTKTALTRCKILSLQQSRAENATQIFNVLLKKLGQQHIVYALDICLAGLPTGRDLDTPKSEPNLQFLSIIQEVNTIWHLAEKQFNDDLLPLITSTPSHARCLDLKNKVKYQMESKCCEVIDRAISLAIGWIRQTLKTKQRAADFSDQNAEMAFGQGGGSASRASRDVCKYISSTIEIIRDMLDGDNLTAVLCELGTRFHKVIREHLESLKDIGMMGGLLLVCDINAYLEVTKNFEVQLVYQLFDVLKQLCNLLMSPPENIRQVCTSEQLANLDREVLHNFVKLRKDYNDKMRRMFL